MISQKKIAIEAYHYSLPEERIALFPLAERDQSKLLVYKNGEITDALFSQLPDFLDPGSMMIFNDSKVIHARLLVENNNQAHIEIFCLEPLFPTTELSKAFEQTGKVTWKCMIGNAKRWKEPILFQVAIAHQTITIKASKGECVEGVFLVTFEWDAPEVSFAEWIEHYGKIPLPPYIKRAAGEIDETRYQTVYAHHDGSVAAPTAGLHFSEKEFELLRKRGIVHDFVTLHVGAGTFKPVSSTLIGEHFMHREQLLLQRSLLTNVLKNSSKKQIAVGTTVARAMESFFIMGAKLLLRLPDPFHVQQWEYYDNPELGKIAAPDAFLALSGYMEQHDLETLTGSTSLIIAPGYEHKVINGLITNFHQPKSTLLLLIASFLGDEWKKIYDHALNNGYRFLSYGDSNLYLP